MNVIIAVIALVVVVAALMSLVRVNHRMRPIDVALWAAIVIVIPIIGPIVWFAFGRKQAQRST
ncbi:PLDc N-terminal domain-containing protein [Clavibacter michiganensis]|uniref:PLDc N-terminal domain-containing protein n=1 Tax=Clavibacter michiganensis TaxID=28447 RepID=UPI00351BC9A7